MTLPAPNTESEITVEWLRDALPWKDKDSAPISMTVEPEFGGPSLLGKITKVNLHYTDGAQRANSVHCSTQGQEFNSADRTNREHHSNMEHRPRAVIVKFQSQIADREREADIYRLLSERKELSVPRLFGAFDNGTLILEELSPFKARSQLEGCTLQEARDVLTILAEIHGSFWRDSRVPSIPLHKFANVINYNMEQCWDRYKDRYKEILGTVTRDFEWMWHNAEVVSRHRLSGPTTLFHGDVHAENLLFDEAGKHRPVLIDWQLAGRGLAANDVSFFLVKSLGVDERRKKEERLLKEYYALLPERVQGEYGFDRFRLDYRACVTRSMLSAIMLVGPRFADRTDQFEFADMLAERVIAAVKDLEPISAIKELQGRTQL